VFLRQHQALSLDVKSGSLLSINPETFVSLGVEIHVNCVLQ